MRPLGTMLILALAVPPGGAAPIPRADWIVHGGPVLTLDPERPRVEAAAFAGGVVLALGALDDVLELRGPRTRELDLNGRALMPSFKDHHVHLLNLGLALLNRERHAALQAELAGLDVESVAATLAERCRLASTGAWVTGAGWSQGVWGDSGLPGHEPLTRACPDNPVLLARVDGHAGWANLAALRFAPSAGAEPPGSRVPRDENGAPTGVLLERANEPLLALVPPLAEADVIAAFRRAVESLTARGVTEVDDAGFLSPPGLVDLEAPLERYLDLLVRADSDRPLPVRVGLMIPAPSALATRVLSGPPELSPRLHVTHLKLFADGALGSRGAALTHPYDDDPSTHGVPRMDRESIERWAQRALDAGLDVATHAIGDAAVASVLDAYEALLTARPSLDPRRLRVEHFSFASEADIARAARLGVVLVVQPGFVWPDAEGHTMEQARVGDPGAARVYAFGRLIRGGARLAGSTDEFSVPEPIFRHVHAGVTRQNPDGAPPGGWQPENRLTRLEGLRLFTRRQPGGGGPARPPLAVGGPADWIVVSADPLSGPDGALPGLRVHRTVAEGVVVFDDGVLEQLPGARSSPSGRSLRTK
ncbi:MAG: amidohydrolase [Acidobacteria bacterium]|nr:amidohydrolase [Acidobacteriota bacterium]